MSFIEAGKNTPEALCAPEIIALRAKANAAVQNIGTFSWPDTSEYEVSIVDPTARAQKTPGIIELDKTEDGNPIATLLGVHEDEIRVVLGSVTFIGAHIYPSLSLSEPNVTDIVVEYLSPTGLDFTLITRTGFIEVLKDENAVHLVEAMGLAEYTAPRE